MNFFKLHKPLVYKYKPIYYDPKKEAQKEREKKMAEDSDQNQAAEYKPFIKRGTFREMADKNKHSSNTQIRQSNVRLVIIILILFFVAYLLIK